MLVATIIFTDIVGFSQKRPEEQSILVQSLNNQVREKLNSAIQKRNSSASSPIFLPTGDGMAVVFIHEENQIWDRSTFMNLIFNLQNWAREKESSIGSVSVRIGVHVGSITLIEDVQDSRHSVTGKQRESPQI